MKQIKFISALLLISFFCRGQEADSLLEFYKGYPDDTTKVNLLYEKGFSFRNKDLPAAIKFAKACYVSALKSNNKMYIAKALNLTGVLRSETGMQEEALADLKRALELRIQTRDTQSQTIILNNIGNVYAAMADNKQALLCYEQALQTARSINSDRWINGALYSMADMQTNLKMYKQAEGNLYTLIGWAQNRNDYEILGMCYQNMSLCKQARGDTSAAEAYQMQAVDIANMTEDDILRADALCALGNIYLAQKRYKESLQHLQEAYSIAARNNYSDGLLTTWKSLSEYYSQTGAHKEAFGYLSKHDSAIANLNSQKVEGLAALWKEIDKPVEIIPAGFSFKNNIFECIMIGAFIVLLLFVLVNRANEQKA